LSRMHSDDALLTPDDATEFLGVSKDTLAQWRSQSRGPRYIKLEKRLVRYRRSDLENYLAAHSVEHPSVRKLHKS
jgi:predicted DNA-binding transcriptional regulator AlpA